MPRPGPRPYECVRRAWHSDRHQPIRGSVIQQIFRVVTEAHGSVTRKNREWQEKLPRVVFKAEEIMYSKANSEAEYVDTDTLWDRLNDAINTIIRRDESTETGQFLQPCIEAALHLGCVPVRASRSERHNNPRNYLNPKFQKTAQAPLMVPDKTNNHGPFSQPPTPSSNQFSTPRSGMANQASTFTHSSSQTVPQYPQTFPRPIPSVATESKPSLNLGPVYPVYYSSHFPNVESQLSFHPSQNSFSDNIIIGRPVGWPRAHPTSFSSTNHFPLPSTSEGSNAHRNKQVRPFDSHGKPVEMDCDLSLRLGPSDHCASVERQFGHMNNDGGSSSHQDATKYAEPLARNRELPLFPRHTASGPSESCDNRLEQELFDRDTTLRKRKAGDYPELGNDEAQRLPKLQPNQFDGQSKWPGW
ncbi:uncharacterized protein LOC141597432 [Silene latifolia]|uniref:uncharacterized protein LOC141597432 n=1 Tax=Silene latifolia TaxID=37657 RepID=UPI003D78ADC2